MDYGRVVSRAFYNDETIRGRWGDEPREIRKGKHERVVEDFRTDFIHLSFAVHGYFLIP